MGRQEGNIKRNELVAKVSPVLVPGEATKIIFRDFPSCCCSKNTLGQKKVKPQFATGAASLLLICACAELLRPSVRDYLFVHVHVVEKKKSNCVLSHPDTEL